VDDPVDLYIDDKLIAKGELVETDDGQIAVKIVEIVEKAVEAE
jgi:flagellar motor switch protein FliN/FliY